ncbi:MAG TPA: STM3941 family protein [Ktedonobacteraceae bacterium]|nr:STM3941 family protein [Ktedonobacteraceae bacterium]
MNYQDSVSQADEQALILYPSRQKVLLLLIGSLIFVGIGIFLFPNASNPLNAGLEVFVIVFFGLCALASIFMLVKPFPLLQASNEGLRSGTFFGDYLISWGEIDFIFFSKTRGISTLNVYLSETGLQTFSVRYPRRGRLRRLFGGPAAAVPLTLLPLPAQQIFDTIQERYQKQIEQYNIYVR